MGNTNEGKNVEDRNGKKGEIPRGEISWRRDIGEKISTEFLTPNYSLLNYLILGHHQSEMSPLDFSFTWSFTSPDNIPQQFFFSNFNREHAVRR